LDSSEFLLHDGSNNTTSPFRPVKKNLLNQFYGTSIAGNDLTASIFYSLGICSIVSGVFLPISLFLVSLAIYPFRNIIWEFLSALPMNGGKYSFIFDFIFLTISHWDLFSFYFSPYIYM